MGILEQNKAYFGMIKSTVLKLNDHIFNSDNSMQSDIGFINKPDRYKLTMKNAKLHFEESGKNIITIGVPLTDIKLYQVNKLSYEDCTVKIRPDFISVNKSETHAILWRLDFGKTQIAKLYPTKTSGANVSPISTDDKYPNDIWNLLSVTKNMDLPRAFPYSRYINILVNGEVMVF